MTDARDSKGEMLPEEVGLTKFGKPLRNINLDELPEIINMMQGDMAVVGLRPLLVQYLERYDEHQMRWHEVRLGFTGLTQVHGRNAISWDEKFNLDVEYVDNVMFLGDWKIIFQTIRTEGKREGISSDTSATMEEFMGNINAPVGLVTKKGRGGDMKPVKKLHSMMFIVRAGGQRNVMVD